MGAVGSGPFAGNDVNRRRNLVTGYTKYNTYTPITQLNQLNYDARCSLETSIKLTRVTRGFEPRYRGSARAGQTTEPSAGSFPCHSAIVSIPVASRQDTAVAGVRTPSIHENPHSLLIVSAGKTPPTCDEIVDLRHSACGHNKALCPVSPWQPNTAPTSIIPPRLSCQAFTRHAGA